VIVIVVIIAAATWLFPARFFAARGLSIGRRSGRSGRAARFTQRHRRLGPSGTFDDLVQFAPVKPDTPAFRAIVNLNAVAVRHHKGFIINRTTHVSSCLHFHHVGVRQRTNKC
jgi:hypothetical protein